MSTIFQTICRELRSSKRPIFIWGAGMRGYASEARALARDIPVATTWGAVDLLPHFNCGSFGTHGTRPANFAVQNADFIISLGCRLDTKATGTPADFAPKAQIVMVDIDQAEIAKMEPLGRPVIGVCMDVGEFIKEISKEIGYWLRPEWLEKITKWKEKYASKDLPEWRGRPYELMQTISKHTTPEDIIVSDTGCTLGWLMQGFPFKGERFIHATNYTPMGYGLGAAIGCAFTGKRVICLVGDGGALMSINELATIKRHRLNIKIVLLNNKGHGMCRQTQRQWLGGEYPATSIEGGLGFPSWCELALSFGIPVIRGELRFVGDGPTFTEVMIDPNASMIPQARYGAPIEDMEPSLSREELRSQMEI